MSSRIGISLRTWFLCLLLAVTTVSGVAQTHTPAGEKAAPNHSTEVTNPDTAATGSLPRESEEAAGEENEQFKRSKAVVWISHHGGDQSRGRLLGFCLHKFCDCCRLHLLGIAHQPGAGIFVPGQRPFRRVLKRRAGPAPRPTPACEQIQGRLSKARFRGGRDTRRG